MRPRQYAEFKKVKSFRITPLHIKMLDVILNESKMNLSEYIVDHILKHKITKRKLKENK